jgi:NAD(P)-dependent dehydrogenase (short-subunit alcohol dehydrogenase family)
MVAAQLARSRSASSKGEPGSDACIGLRTMLGGRGHPQGEERLVTRHVLVTGAAGGLGGAIAARFAAAGDRITGVDLTEEPLRASVAALAAAHGVPVDAIPADLSDPGAGGVVDRAWGRSGPVDVLVNAAGIWPAIPLLDMTAARWDHVLAINTRAPMLTTVALGRLAVAAERAASVVNLASGAAIRARPGASHYCTSKAALEMSTRSCAVELGGHGIRVNTVSPGTSRAAARRSTRSPRSTPPPSPATRSGGSDSPTTSRVRCSSSRRRTRPGPPAPCCAWTAAPPRATPRYPCTGPGPPRRSHRHDLVDPVGTERPDGRVGPSGCPPAGRDRDRDHHRHRAHPSLGA